MEKDKNRLRPPAASAEGLDKHSSIGESTAVPAQRRPTNELAASQLAAQSQSHTPQVRRAHKRLSARPADFSQRRELAKYCRHRVDQIFETYGQHPHRAKAALIELKSKFQADDRQRLRK